MARCPDCGKGVTGSIRHRCSACQAKHVAAWRDNDTYEAIDATKAIPQPTKRTGPGAKEITPMPAMHLSRIAGKFPKFWKSVEAFRANRAYLGGWPAWCYCPVAGAYAIVSGGSSARLSMSQAMFVPELAAVAAWRPTKGVYRFDPDLFDAIADTPITGDLPVEVLHRLPEWCVYVETRGRMTFSSNSPIHGFFAHLEYDANDRRSELRVLLDCGEYLLPYIVHLGLGTLRQGIEWIAESAKRKNEYGLPDHAFDDAVASGLPVLNKCVSLLLYLCSEEPDYLGEARPSRTEKRSKGGKVKGQEAPVVWDVGVRVGADLRRARRDQSDSSSLSDGTHASPRPHFRRAHWHTYLTGRGRTIPVVRWVSPILVGTETIATIRRVEEVKS